MTATRKPIPGWPGYEVSDAGEVWSSKTSSGPKVDGGGDWKLIRGGRDRDGYHTITLSSRGRAKTYRLAHLVLEAFHGPRPEGTESAHYPDPSPSNNRADNLLWTTHRDNIQHKMELHRQAHGVSHGSAKLTEAQVRAMRQEHEAGRFVTLGRKYGVTTAHAQSICQRRTWRHLA